jgi:16S rRNA (cytosine967-C5)-methyltransferase
MTLTPQAERIAFHILAKYCRKGNMARCLRDILPTSRLSRDERSQIADLMHDIVRWKKQYDFLLEQQHHTPTPEVYLSLASSPTHELDASLPLEYRYSCSSYVAQLFENHPDWAMYLNTPPPTTLCVNHNKTTIDVIIQQLQQEQFSVERGCLNSAVRSASSALKSAEVIRQHLAHVQDESSQLAAAIAVEQGDRVLDFCAGNGGKTLTMASLGKNSKDLVAFETDERRRETLQRRCLEYDAKVTVSPPSMQASFDFILVDAPCTGLGAARRNPEAKYIEDADEYPQLQLSILQQASGYLKAEGCLLYVVCTITPEETSEVISRFTSASSFEILPISAPYESYLSKSSNGYFTNIPQGDLFFLSFLKKTSV